MPKTTAAEGHLPLQEPSLRLNVLMTKVELNYLTVGKSLLALARET